MNAVRALVVDAIAEGAFPGAAWAYGSFGRGEIGFAGRQTYCPESARVSVRTVWDLASVTKVIATTSLAMRLVARSVLHLDRPVAFDWPEFGVNGKSEITPRHLLRHDAGLIAFRPYHRTLFRPRDVLPKIEAEGLTYSIGSKSVYSDLSMIVLGHLIERLVQKPLAVSAREEIFRPLRMRRTGYFDAGVSTAMNPIGAEDVAPTEIVEPWRRDLRRATYGDRGARLRFGDAPEYIRAEVHDPTAAVLGGVAGHAGLFAPLDDLVRFAHEMLADAPIALPRSERDVFVRRQRPGSTRALGWDTNADGGMSCGSRFGPRSFGHTGYTGTSLWLDPDAGFFAILLTNRVHPTSENGKILALRPRFHDAAWRAWFGPTDRGE